MKHELENCLPMRKACEVLGVVPMTLRRWEKAGKIQAIRTPSGQRRYARSEILRLLGENHPKGVRAAIYARVSSAKQAGEGNLERQRQRLEKYAQERSYEIKAVIAEQGSGLNEKRKGLDRIFKMAREGKIDLVIIEFKDNMFTVKGVLIVEGCLAATLINFMRIFQAAKRTAYQAVRRGVKREEIISALQEKFIRSIGQANQKGLKEQPGNANTEIFFDGENFFLSIYPPNDEGIKLGRGIPRRDEDWLTLPLSIPAPYVKNLVEHLTAGRPYTVQVIRKKNRFFCHVSFTLEDTAEVDRTSKMGGIDLNPQVISAAIVHPIGNYLVSRNFPCPDLPYLSHEQRLHVIGRLCKEIAGWLKEQGVTQVALEELFFNQDHDTSRFFNRMSHNFSHKAMFVNLVIRLRKEGIAVFTVDPKFTSLIGFTKYKDTYGLAVHQAAVLVIARRALGCKEKLPKEIKRLLAPKEGQPHLSTWGKLFGIVKAARQKARKNGDHKRNWTIESYLTYAKLKTA